MEQLRSKVLLALLVAAVAFGSASVAMAQAQFDLRTTPTTVHKTGRSEVMGRVLLTATSTNPTVAGTLQVLYQGVPIDNAGAAGTAVEISENNVCRVNANCVTGTRGIVVSTNITANNIFGATANFTITNTANGGQINIPILVWAPALGDTIAVDGVRGRIDMSFANTAYGSAGADIHAALSANPSNLASFAPTSEVVARSSDGLNVVVTAATYLQCAPGASFPKVSLREVFPTGFVQHIDSESTPANAAPTDARGATFAAFTNFGGTANTQFLITVNSLPAGVSLDWPSTGASLMDRAVASGGGGTASRLQLIAEASDGSTASYEFVTDAPAGGTNTQGPADSSLQRMDVTFTDINPAAAVTTGSITIPATGPLGTATASATLRPGLVSGDATTLTSAATTPTGARRPRFAPLQRPSPAGSFITIAACRTSLLWPYVPNRFPQGSDAAGNAVAGSFDTGLVLAATGFDNPAFVSGAADFGAGGPPGGNCRWYAFQQLSTHNATTGASGTGTPTSPTAVTRGPMTEGDTDVMLATAIVGTTAWQGYMITVCDFQYAHGFAFIFENALVAGQLPTSAQGYLALIIPDPLGNGGRFASDPSKSATITGEGLVQ